MMMTGEKKTDLAPIYTDTILKMATVIKKCKENQDTWKPQRSVDGYNDNPFLITRDE